MPREEAEELRAEEIGTDGTRSVGPPPRRDAARGGWRKSPASAANWRPCAAKRRPKNDPTREPSRTIVKTHIGINGAAGRMGQRLVHLAHEDPDLPLVAALESPATRGSARTSARCAASARSACPSATTSPLGAARRSVIDFSVPEGTMALLPACVERKHPARRRHDRLHAGAAGARSRRRPTRSPSSWPRT